MAMEFDEEDGLRPSDAKELLAAFSVFDKNKDGKISTSELGAVMRSLGQNPTEAELQQFMKKFDKDESGFITQDEYLKLIEDHMIDPQIIEIKLREAFRVFDKNRDGSLDFDEMQKALMLYGEPLSTKECIDLVKLADTDKDGKVDVDEFVKLLCQRI